MTRIAYPFLTLGPSAVDASPWAIARGSGEFHEAADFLTDWDYATPIKLRRSIRIDPAIAALDLDLKEADIALSSVIRAGTGQGRLPRSIVAGIRREFSPSSLTVEIDLELQGNVLSSVLHVDTSIVLAREPQTPGDLSPRRVGDRLWRDALRVRLEGEEPRFPLEIADFRVLLGNSPAAAAPWFLHWSPHDWNRDFHGSIRLYLNGDHPSFIDKVEAEDPETLRFLLGDVMGQICESLVRNDEAASIIASSDENSLGAQAARWLELAFPGRDLGRAKSVLEGRPGIFRAIFQAIAEQRQAEL